jgi:catechol 2,3-dioxygenase-like lactoylglutathione lyase family enzyme
MKNVAEAEAEIETERGMFRDTRAFSSFSVKDLAETKKFYAGTLGLEVDERPEGLELQIAGGSKVFVYPKKDHQPATFTILNFPVEDAEKAVAALRKRGVRFEVYKEGEMRTDENGIAGGHGMKIAWFKDPAGNFLSVIEG